MSAATDERRGLRLPAHLGPTVLLLLSVLALVATVWGALNPVDVDVAYADAGPVEAFEIGRVDAFPDNDFYVVGLEDGRIRALDGRIPDSECSVVWRSGDQRGTARNPLGNPGVFEDPCGTGVWAMTGDAISGTNEPMLTPHMDHRIGDGGPVHLYVEIINPGQPR